MLKATFVRNAGERDRIYVTRSDGSEVSWSFPSYGDGLPHDLVHSLIAQCRSLGAPPPDLSPIEAERIRSALRELSHRWRSLLPKGSLTVTFPGPEGGPWKG